MKLCKMYLLFYRKLKAYRNNCYILSKENEKLKKEIKELRSK